MIKQLFCKHDWVKVEDTRMGDDTSYISFNTYRAVLAYCPKCKKQRTFYLGEWNTMKKIQEIDIQYSRCARTTD